MAKRKSARKKKVTGPKNTVGSQEPTNLETLRAALEWIVQEGIFKNITLHGNTAWLPADLVVLAVLWVWSDKTSLTEAFTEARSWSLRMLGRVATGTYQGLTGALVRWTGTFLPLLWQRLHQLMKACGGEFWRIGKWLPLALDGSRVSTPRTKANEKAFCAKNYGQGKTARYRKKKNKGMRRKKKTKPQPVKPQIWITLLWHMGMRLPWSWKIGPSNSSERHHQQEMLTEQKFPENTLFCGDAGFVGYEFWKSIRDAGHHFVMRVGANVRLLRKLGYVRERDGIVYCWPDKAAKKNQPPLVMRLLHFRAGDCDIYVVTSVLDPRELSDRQIAKLYKLRWGIEVQFRTLKQTFGRRTLRSRTPDRAEAELHWSLLGLWMIQLFAVKEQIAIGIPPVQSSVSLAVRVIRAMLFHWNEIPTPGEDLASQLQNALKDRYQRTSNKAGRYKPAYKDKPSAGKPVVVTAKQKHKQNLKKYLNQIAV